MNRERLRIKARSLLLLLTFLPLYGCGGGSSSSSSPTPEVLCSGGTPSTNKTPSSDQMVVYQSTCQGSVNTPVVTLTICVPNTTTCEDVPNILVDLGSTGLRLSHTLSISSQLPQENENGPITECYAFVSGYNYGPVVTATVTLANQTVKSVPVQISNSTLSAPSSCTKTGPSAPFEPAINGILGVLFPQDDGGDYYEGGSGPTTISTALMVQNPVFLLPSGENDGVLLSNFPIVFTQTGSPSVSGLLTFGTGNIPGLNLTQLDTNASATITAIYNSSSLTAFFDSGSNGWFIDNSYTNIPECTSASLSGFFCGQASIKVTLTGTNTSSSVKVSFSIVSAQTLLNTGNQDFSSLGGPFMPQFFDAGFPAFLYGDTIGVGWNPATPNSPAGYFLYGN